MSLKLVKPGETILQINKKSRILIYFGLIKVKKVQRYDPGGKHCTNLVYFYKLNVFRVSLKTTSMQIQWKLDAK